MIPVNIVTHNGSAKVAACQYLVVNENDKGDIIGGNYAMVLIDKTKSNTITQTDITPGLLSFKEVPENFNGAIFEYNLRHELISTKHFENGKEFKGKTDQVSFKFKEKDKSDNTSNNLPEVCIDWYWQVFQNGVLIYETYLGRTCSGGEGGGSGGGGSNLCENALNGFSNGAPSQELRSITTLSANATTRTKEYKWICFVNFGGWGLLSSDWGTHSYHYTPSENTPDWEWNSFQHISIAKEGMTIGGSEDHSQVIATPTLGIYNAVMNLQITVVYSIVCQYSPLTISHTYPCNKMFNVNDGEVVNPQ